MSSNSNNVNTLKEKPVWLCPSWIKTPCAKQLNYRLNGKKKTAKLAVWDSTSHDHAVDQLKRKLTKKKFSVRTEVKHQIEFPGFILAHWFDLIAIKDDNILIIEVKPKDHEHNNKQYEYAQLLANSIYGDFVYLVYEYKKERLIPKMQPIYPNIIAAIQSKLSQSREKSPKTQITPLCVFCPFAQCENHPQHES